jgi:hypothetical protein
MSIDEFSRTTSRAYVPLLDQWFDDVAFFSMETKKAEDVGKGLAAQRDRLAELEKLAESLEEADQKAEAERPAPTQTAARVKEIEALLEEGDRDAVDLADQMVRWMSRELDQAEDDGRSKALEQQFGKEYETARELTAQDENSAERKQADALAAEFKQAIRLQDFDGARQKIDDMHNLVFRLLRRLPGYWEAVFAHLANRLIELNLGSVAVALIERGKRHSASGSVSDLAQVCFEMAQLLPASEKKDGVAGIVSHVK